MSSELRFNNNLDNEMCKLTFMPRVKVNIYTITIIQPSFAYSQRNKFELKRLQTNEGMRKKV